jgi:hypothetical protein
MPRIEIERLDQEIDRDEESSETSREVFDRIAFAERAVELIRPPNTRVAICEGVNRVHIMIGRQWGSGPLARWAVVRIPHNASRRAIASAVLELWDGREPNARAWALDVLMTELGRPEVHPMRMFGGGAYR